jgi:hypothetical protein
MGVSPANSASFAVWTPGNVRLWAQGGKENPVGRGSPNSLYNDDLAWSGSFNLPGTYYIVVDQTGLVASTINLQVTGSGVSLVPPAGTPVPTGSSSGGSSAMVPPAVIPAYTYNFVTITPSPTPPGRGPGDALSVTGSSQTIQAGRRLWYAFQYSGDKSQILVRMSVWPANSVSFAVWTPTDVQLWPRAKKENPVGRGSPNSLYGGDLTWTGSFNLPGTYYVVVDQAGPVAGNFNLQVTGSGVSLVSPTRTPTPAPTTRAPFNAGISAQAAAPVAPSYGYNFVQNTPTPVPPGTGPDSAAPVPAVSQTLAVGQRLWYAFQYSGDGSQILVRMSVWPANSASFAVWTPGDVQRWAQGGKAESPVGRGSPNRLYGGDLTWSGNFNQPGTYYVVVDQTGPAASTIDLKVTTGR